MKSPFTIFYLSARTLFSGNIDNFNDGPNHVDASHVFSQFGVNLRFQAFFLRFSVKS